MIVADMKFVPGLHCPYKILPQLGKYPFQNLLCAINSFFFSIFYSFGSNVFSNKAKMEKIWVERCVNRKRKPTVLNRFQSLAELKSVGLKTTIRNQV